VAAARPSFSIWRRSLSNRARIRRVVVTASSDVLIGFLQQGAYR
jgi:hypothetical protein